MIAILLLLAVIWQLFAGTLLIAPLSRKSDPAFFWLVIAVECAVMAWTMPPQLLSAVSGHLR